MSGSNDVWQVEVQGQIYEAELDELKQWVSEGAVLSSDKVRRGNLRWIQAEKVPALQDIFNLAETSVAISNAVNTNFDSPPPTEAAEINETNNESAEKKNAAEKKNIFVDEKLVNKPIFKLDFSSAEIAAEVEIPNFCLKHPEKNAAYACDVCENRYCKNCPKTYGGVKICPDCGGLCRSANAEPKKSVGAVYKPYGKTDDETEEAESRRRFNFSDLGNALTLPLKYPASLIMGGILYVIFTLGQNAAAVGGIFMLGGAIVCGMFANMLVFGCLANTVEYMSQGVLERNFMPNFDEFSLWDDAVHPLFLSIGVYIASFGLLAALFVAGSSFATAPKSGEQNAAVRISQAQTLPEEIKNSVEKRESAEISNVEELAAQQKSAAEKEEDEFRRLNEMIEQSRRQQLESAIGKPRNSEGEKTEAVIARFSGMSPPFLIFGLLLALWGIFYLPAGVAVAAYTRSFTAAINPLVGIDTIIRMGIDYAKILAVFILLGAASVFVFTALNTIFAPLELPLLGNLPAQILSGFFTFYLSVVFGGALGYALFRNSQRLNLFR